MSAGALLAAAPAAGAHGRLDLDAAGWARLAAALAADAAPPLLALWGVERGVRAAFLDPSGRPVVAAAPAAPGYAALSPARPGAALFERAARDLAGIVAEGAVDLRPWLDHTAPPEPLPAEGPGLHRILVGPIHAGVIEPGEFRFTVQGEAVVRLELRLGFTHKGTLALMRGKPPWAAARFAARLSGDSTVAHATAFALAVEAACGAAAPPRAEALRALMLEWERIANHLLDWGAIGNDAAFAAIHAEAWRLREGMLRAAGAAFGHRLMMDRVVPGGVAADLSPDGAAALRAAAEAVERAVPGLARIVESHASLQDRLVGTGVIAPALAEAFAAGGVVGRASGRRFDARLLPSPLPYAALAVSPAVRQEGDVAARLAVRIAEIGESLRLVRALLAALPEGPLSAPLPAAEGEGVALVEGFRGECFAFVALDAGGTIREVFLRDPSWLHWPLLEAAVQGNIVADFPLINKSINGSYSGCDL
jgi:Ni,Fe-hydrogenase III large subunit